MWKVYELLTDEDTAPLKTGHPMAAKKRLAERLVANYHGLSAGAAARAGFDRVFSRREVPADMPEHRPSRTGLTVLELMVESGCAPSKNEARRLLQQGAVEWDGGRLSADGPVVVDVPTVLKVGKRQFRRILPPALNGA
jgi:tyrosyl-tRNA synthetase